MAVDTRRDGLTQEEAVPVKSRAFPIDGKEYEIPLLDSLDLDEEQILYDISGIVQTDFLPAHPDASEEEKRTLEIAQSVRIRDPRFKRALVHIAYRRGNRDASFEEIEAVVGKVSAIDSELALLGGDVDPPAESSPRQPESGTSTSEPSSSGDSGSPSGSGSGEVVEIREATGTGR